MLKACDMTIAKLTLGGTPKIVLSVKDDLWLSQRNKNRLFDLVEFRIDLVSSLALKAILQTAVPTILTIRSKKEGGNWTDSEPHRLLLYQDLIPHFSAVDIELSSNTILDNVVENAHDEGKKVIVSYHNFDKTPKVSELYKILKKAKKTGADIVKVAAFAKNHQDIQTLARFTVENADQHIVTIAMGELGKLSRLFFPALGSLLIYASLSAKDKTAPGQMDCKELSRLVKKFYPI
jgi:3-dehydroquinate dehydratase-1